MAVLYQIASRFGSSPGGYFLIGRFSFRNPLMGLFSEVCAAFSKIKPPLGVSDGYRIWNTVQNGLPNFMKMSQSIRFEPPGELFSVCVPRYTITILKRRKSPKERGGTNNGMFPGTDCGSHRHGCRFHSGKEKVLGFLVGQVMKKMRGKADPGMVNELLRKKL